MELFFIFLVRFYNSMEWIALLSRNAKHFVSNALLVHFCQIVTRLLTQVLPIIELVQSTFNDYFLKFRTSSDDG